MNDPTPALVRNQVERIIASPQFASSRKLARFLQLIVEEALAGRRDQIKEYFVGVEVYNRPEGYDPRVDATVRVEASKLRKRLSEYYDGQGRNDVLLITIPKGHYAPVFQERGATEFSHRFTRRSRQMLLVTVACLITLAAIGIYRINISEPAFRLSEHRLFSTFPGSHS